MATVNLGSIKFNWQGAYAGGTAYAVDDVVSYNGSSYICKLASTGNLPTNTTYWDQMSSAGTNGTDGTDVGTVITTQGDILYRDGSGLARLGAGTAGQVLQSGGTGANVSWGTVSSDFVKLADTTTTGSESSIIIDGYFTSDYDFYKVFLSNLCINADTQGHIGIRYRISNANFTATGYYSSNDGTYKTSSATNNWNGGEWQNDKWGLGGWNMPTVNASGRYRTVNFEVTIPSPLDTNTYKNIQVHGGGWERAANYTYNINQIGSISTQDALSGITFYNVSGGTFASGCRIVLYGMKS